MTAQRPVPGFDSRPNLPVALVVGAGGMSMVIAQQLGQSHRVVLASLGEDELAGGQTKLHEMGAICMTFACDITQESSVAALANALAASGPVQAVANVAGMSVSNGSGTAIAAVNLAGAARIERALLPLMAAGGAAVFISSMAAHLIPPPAAPVLAAVDDPLAPELAERLEQALNGELTPGSAYSLAKLGVNRMVRRRARAWGERRARIVSLSPGLIDSPMGLAESGSGNRSQMQRSLPLGRQGTMAEIADAVDFLVSPRASYISGTDILVDGGMSAAMQSEAALGA